MIINIVLFLVYLFLTYRFGPWGARIEYSLGMLLPLFLLAIPMVIYYKVRKQKINQRLIITVILVIGIIYSFFYKPPNSGNVAVIRQQLMDICLKGDDFRNKNAYCECLTDGSIKKFPLEVLSAQEPLEKNPKFIQEFKEIYDECLVLLE